MKKRLLRLLLLWSACTVMSCATGDDLSTPPPGPAPVSRWSFTIDALVNILSETCHRMIYAENDAALEYQFFKTIDDTVFLKGSQIPGGTISVEHTPFTPVDPVVGTEWYGQGSNLFTVLDYTDVTVPAGTFPSFIIQISDSTSGDLLGSLVLAYDVGIVSMVHTSGDDTIRSIVLDNYSILGGEGVLPLGIGNDWNLVKGTYTTE